MTNSYYQSQKARFSEEAKEWQRTWGNNNYSYGELAYYGNYFTKIGKIYGLIKEFKENGII